MQPNTRLNKDDCDKNPAPDFHRRYRGIVCSLGYLVTMTRPDLAWAYSEISMMMIAFITIQSSLVPLIEGLCAQIYFRFEISVVCSHLLLFFFVKEKIC